MSFNTVLLLATVASVTLAQVVLVKEPPQDNVMISENAPGLRLVCYVNDTSTDAPEVVETPEEAKSKIKWFLTNDTQTPTNEFQIDDKYVIINSQGHSILLMNEMDAAHGTITCKMEEKNLQKSWEVAKLFRVKHLERSHTVVAGEDLELFCKLRQNADMDGVLTFTWYKVNEGEEETEGSLLKNSTATSDEFDPHIRIKNFGQHSALKIEDVTYEDRAVYRCVAKLVKSSQTLNSTTETLVRVKDKYSALYPFLGIVAEVVVLALVIFICERRKSSEGEDEDDDDYNSTGAGGATGNGNSNLRHRRH